MYPNAQLKKVEGDLFFPKPLKKLRLLNLGHFHLGWPLDSSGRSQVDNLQRRSPGGSPRHSLGVFERAVVLN